MTRWDPMLVFVLLLTLIVIIGMAGVLAVMR